jgi:hypothetical protein
MLFKYDDYYKNFGYYLPSAGNQFIFAVIFKSKKQVVFGVISQFLGKEAKSIAFNLNTMKVFKKSDRSRVLASNYDSGFLKFGH